MMSITKEDTKEKILHIALKLFCDNGYEKTSIREISKQADVNVASINYHFSSKDGLYKECLMQCMLETKIYLEELVHSKKIQTTEDLAIALFKYHISSNFNLHNRFKMFIYDAKELPEVITNEIAQFGPPGGKFFKDFICKDLEVDSIDENDWRWATKVIFAHVAHTSLIMKSEAGKTLNSSQPELWSEEGNIKGIKRLVKLILNSLKN